jgi:hypothetical protein
MVQAFGIWLIVNFLKIQPRMNKNENEKFAWSAFFSHLLVFPALVLLTGWVGTYFLPV